MIRTLRAESPLLAAVLLLSACRARTPVSAPGPEASGTPPAHTATDVGVASADVPSAPHVLSPTDRVPSGPCTRDDECVALLDSCSCDCIGRLAAVPEPPVSNADWAHMCNGGPPGPCGTAPDCWNKHVVCDTVAHQCAVRMGPAPDAGAATPRTSTDAGRAASTYCGSDAECAAGLHCIVPPHMENNGTCSVPGTFNDQCDLRAPYCLAGLHCDARTHRCVR